MKHLFSEQVLKQNQDIIRNFQFPDQRFKLIVQNAIYSYQYVNNGQYISNLGDLLNYSSLSKIRQKMLNDPIGLRILEQKPRIRLDISILKSLPENTFGSKYYNWMTKQSFDPSERPIVTYIPEFELAYIQQRYKEIHDFLHVILNLETSVEDEILLKWFEMVQLEFPSTALAALVGGTKIQLSKKKYLENQPNFICNRLPKILKNAYQSKFILNFEYEHYFNKDIDFLRSELNIKV